MQILRRYFWIAHQIFWSVFNEIGQLCVHVTQSSDFGKGHEIEGFLEVGKFFVKGIAAVVDEEKAVVESALEVVWIKVLGGYVVRVYRVIRVCLGMVVVLVVVPWVVSVVGVAGLIVRPTPAHW